MNIFGFDIQRRESTGAAQGNGQAVTRSANIRGNIVQASSERTALMIASVYRAVWLRADTVAQCKLKYQVRSRKGRNFIDADMFEDGKRQNWIMQVRPNPYTTATELIRRVEIRRVMQGNAYVYVKRGVGGMQEEWYLCDSAVLIPGKRKYNITYTVGGMTYSVNDVDMDDIQHHKNTYSFDGQTGVSTLTFACRDFNIAATQDQLTLDSASRGGKRSLVISEQGQQTMGLGKVAKKEMEKMADKLDEEWSDSMVHYLPNAAEVKDFSMSLQELELLASRKFSVAEVSRYFGVPRNLLGDDTNSSYKTPEAATLEFLSRTIAPILLEWENELNGKLLTVMDFGKYRYHMCELPLFRLDRAGQAAWNKNRIETGVASINELRAEQDMPYIGPIGDEYYVSTNLAVAGSDKLRKGGSSGSTPDQPADNNNDNNGKEGEDGTDE